MSTEQADIIIEAGPDIDLIDEDAIRAEVATLDIGGYGETDDERTLARYMRRLSQLADERQRVKDWHDKRIKAIESQAKAIEYVYGGMVRDIARRMLANAKKKSIATPWGIAGFRTSSARLFIADPDKLLLAAADHPEWVKVEKKPVHAAVAEYFKATGDIPAGCDVKPEEETFYTR